jgi:hypothetical protein
MDYYTIGILVFIALFGAVTNRIRGGLLNIIAAQKGWVTTKNDFGEPESKILKTTGKLFNDFSFGLIQSLLIGFTWYGFFILSFAMMIGRSAGWGAYIMGLIKKQVLKEKEVEFIDDLVGDWGKYPVLNNTLKLSLRGLLWTGCLYLGFSVVADISGDTATNYDLALFLCGGLMGVVYAAAVEIAGKYAGLRDKGWSYGEYGIGAIIWLFSALRSLI